MVETYPAEGDLDMVSAGEFHGLAVELEARTSLTLQVFPTHIGHAYVRDTMLFQDTLEVYVHLHG